MAFQADIRIESPEGTTVAVVEIKNLANVTRDTAIALRQDLLDYGLPRSVPFFLLLSQESGFLWKWDEQQNADVAPAADFSMSEVVSQYLPQEISLNRRLRGNELELLVLRWLYNLAWMSAAPRNEAEEALAEAGFIEAIRGAKIYTEALLETA